MKGGQCSAPVVGETGGMVDDVRLVGEQGKKRVGLSCGDGRIEVGGVRGRGVRSHPAQRLRYRLRWRHQRTFGRQLVEAGERLGLAVEVEVLATGQEAIAAEDHER